MAGELQVATTTGRNVYGQIWNSIGQISAGAGDNFEAYLTAQIANYDSPMSELGTASGWYTVTFPSTIAAGIYTIRYINRAGGAPAEGDLDVVEAHRFHWNGSAAAVLGTLAAFKSVPDDKTWTARVGSVSNDVITVDSAYDDFYAMDFTVPLQELQISIDEATSPTVVDQSANSLATNSISVSNDRLKVFFKTGALTAARVYELKITCTTTGPTANLISTGVLRTN